MTGPRGERVATRSSEIPCRVDETARGGSDPVQYPAQIGETLPALQGAAGNTEGKTGAIRSP